MKIRERHPYFMFDEITLQPSYVKKLLLAMKYQNHEMILDKVKKSKRVFLTGCGTSYNAAISSYSISQIIFRGSNKFRSLPARELMSPHFELDKDDMVIGFSHSGETKATLDALQFANYKDCSTAIVTGSSMSSCANESHYILSYGYKYEKSLAHTISYTLSVLLMLIFMGKLAGKIGDIKSEKLVNYTTSHLPLLLKDVMSQHEMIKKTSTRLINKNLFVFCGHENSVGISLEAALKCGEVHYTPTIYMDVEHIFHGPLVMCDRNSLIILIHNNLKVKNRSAELIKATKAIGSTSLIVTSKKNKIYEADYNFILPECHELLVPILYTLPMQLLSYYIAVAKKLNPDLIRRDELAYKKARECYV